MSMELLTLELALLLFWAAWFSIVFLTNLFGGLKALGVLPESWRFASKNYEAVAKATSIYAAPSWVPPLLFAGVVLWQLLAAALYAWAFAHAPEDAAILAPMALLFGAEQAQWAADRALHYHGGYGFMEEYDIQLFYRRAKGWPLASSTAFSTRSAELADP